MSYVSINPTTGKVLKKYRLESTRTLLRKLECARQESSLMRGATVEQRSRLLQRIAEKLREKRDIYATLITTEMGKPIAQARAEVDKCAWVCEWYSERTRDLLQDEIVETEAEKSYVTFEPLGVVLGIMPWNFPFWQVFRFAVPAIAAGNCVVVKHASNVPQCAEAIESVFREAGVSEGVFQILYCTYDQVKKIIRERLVDGVSLTGSTEAGSRVAGEAGIALLPSVMELGGSDPVIILAEANLKKAVEVAWQSRIHNNGQSCIAAKRFIVAQEIAELFVEYLRELISNTVVGDPMEEATQLGPLATREIRERLHWQVRKSSRQGARIIIGGKPLGREGFFYEPTLMRSVRPGMPVWDEETFGPVVAMCTFKTEEEAVQLANASVYGLGASIWSEDIERADRIARRLQAGMVFINAMVRSDPRLPFGGIKKSGYGRELSHYGLKGFCNIKTVWIER